MQTPEVYSEKCQTFEIQHFWKIFNGSNPDTIFANWWNTRKD